MPPDILIMNEKRGADQSVEFWAVFYFFLGLPHFRHVSYKLIGNHCSVFFFPLVFSSFLEK